MNISEDFTRRVADDRLCAAVRQAVEEGNTAALERLGMRGFGRYAGRLAELIEESVRLGVDPDDLGFETLINELASPARYAHHLVNESGTAIQTALDSRNGLRIKPAEPEFESGRFGAIVSEAAHSESETAADTLAVQIGTMTKDAGNRFMEANAEQRDRAGFKVTVRRTGGANCCPWCSARTGSWELKNAPDGVFGCHDNCKCMVDYTNSAGTVRGKAVGRKWNFTEIPYEPPHVMTHEEAREKGGFDEPKRLTGAANGGIINISNKVSDRYVDLYAESDAVFDMELVDKLLSSSFVGQDSVKYFDDNYMNIEIYYNYDSEGVAGQLIGKNIYLYALYNDDEEELASTIIHEISHDRFNWKGTQEAEVNCFIMEAMHRNNGIVTTEDIQEIVDSVRESYYYLPEGDLYGF